MIGASICASLVLMPRRGVTSGVLPPSTGFASAHCACASAAPALEALEVSMACGAHAARALVASGDIPVAISTHPDALTPASLSVTRL